MTRFLSDNKWFVGIATGIISGLVVLIITAIYFPSQPQIPDTKELDTKITNLKDLLEKNSQNLTEQQKKIETFVEKTVDKKVDSTIGKKLDELKQKESIISTKKEQVVVPITNTELLKNGDFDSGLNYWKTGVFEYKQEEYPATYFDCNKPNAFADCQASGYGYPLYRISDEESVGNRYFYANVPAFVWGGRTAVSLEQDVKIPTSSKITLEFDAKGFSQTQIQIYVKEKQDFFSGIFGKKESTVLINQLKVSNERWQMGPWIHRAYDLTDFSGKEITLQFVFSESAEFSEVDWEEERTAIYFDNVSLRV